MKNLKKEGDSSRRKFFSTLFPGIQDDGDDKREKPEMIKLLTADGKIVEVEKSVVAAAAKNTKSSNRDIYQWMNNPSKEPNI